MDVPLRAARRGRRALPAGASRSPAGAARAHGGHGDICGRGRRPRRPASPGTSPCARHGRPHARMDVPVRAAWTSPARGAPRTSRPTSRRIPAPVGAARAHGGHGDICGRGRRPRRPASPERPRARSVRVPLRAARRGRRALPAAHPVPLCRETLRPPPGRCGHERTAARCAILFSLRGTDECGRVPVRGVHHGTAKRRKPKRPCV